MSVGFPDSLIKASLPRIRGVGYELGKATLSINEESYGIAMGVDLLAEADKDQYSKDSSAAINGTIASGPALPTPAQVDPSHARWKAASSDDLPPPPGSSVALGVGAILVSMIILIHPLLRLYYELKRKSLLWHPMRKRILRLVTEMPGRSGGDLALILGVHPSTFGYHANLLEKHGLLCSRVVAKWKIYFERDCEARAIQCHRGRTREAMSRHPLLEELLPLLETETIPSLSVLARRLGRTRQSLKWHVARWTTHGLLSLDKEGRRLIVRSGTVSGRQITVQIERRAVEISQRSLVKKAV
jgi:predicted transcriptional regulator